MFISLEFYNIYTLFRVLEGFYSLSMHYFHYIISLLPVSHYIQFRKQTHNMISVTTEDKMVLKQWSTHLQKNEEMLMEKNVMTVIRPRFVMFDSSEKVKPWTTRP